MSEFRYCKFTQEWTLFAPERLKRPIYFTSQHTLRKEEEECPFDRGKEEYTPMRLTALIKKASGNVELSPISTTHSLLTTPPLQAKSITLKK